MKPGSLTERSWSLRGALCLALVLTLCNHAADAWGRLPRPYENGGVIESVDLKNRTLRLVEPAKSRCPLGRIIKPMEFGWMDQTSFDRDGRTIQPSDLRAGQTVRVFYFYPSKGKPCLTKLVVDPTAPNAKEQK